MERPFDPQTLEHFIACAYHFYRAKGLQAEGEIRPVVDVCRRPRLEICLHHEVDHRQPHEVSLHHASVLGSRDDSSQYVGVGMTQSGDCKHD